MLGSFVDSLKEGTMQFNNEALRNGMKHAIDEELIAQCLALDPASLDKITQAAYNAVVGFLIMGAIETSRQNQKKEEGR